jgi:hypothetical protein
MNFFHKNYIALLLISGTFLTNCTAFKSLPSGNINSRDISGKYLNSSIPDTLKKKDTTLWNLFQDNKEIMNIPIFVKFQVKSEKSIEVTFWNQDSLLAKRILKGKFKKDNCYYLRRKFSFVPILPILWWYSNEQKRIYKIADDLFIEQIGSTGGAAIIMAGGSNYDNLWKFANFKTLKE